MKISIVIATFNAAKHLAECLESCIAQTWQDKEIIVIDGGSTDGTVDIVKRYEQHIAYWHSKPDRGIYDAWNQALDHVTGDWVLFRGADDRFWSSHSLNKASQALEMCEADVLFAYGQVVCVDLSKSVVGFLDEAWQVAGPRLCEEMTIAHPGCFHRRTAFGLVGLFDHELSLAGDYEWFLRAVRKGRGADLPNVIVSCMSVGGATGKQFRRSCRESIAARRKNGVDGIPVRLYGRLGRYVVRYTLNQLGLRSPRSQRHAMAAWDRLRRHNDWSCSHVDVYSPKVGA